MVAIHGFFINLDRSPERAAFMQAQLERLGMAWVRRFPAVDGSTLAVPPGCPLLPGEAACFRSHWQVLENAPPDAFTLVLEDDTELSPQLPQILAEIVQAPPPAFDVAMLECQPEHTIAHVSELWDTAWRHFAGGSRRITGVGLLDARTFFKWGTPGYLVPPGGRDRLLQVLRAGWAEGPVMPVDDCMTRAFRAGELRGVLTVPFLATTALQWHGRSDIGNGARVPGDPLMVLRRLLYAGELGGIEALAQGFATIPVDPALRMFTMALRELAHLQQLEAQRKGHA